MFEEQLKQWIKENLEVKVTYRIDGAFHIELRFVGDKHPFSSDYLNLDE